MNNRLYTKKERNQKCLILLILAMLFIILFFSSAQNNVTKVQSSLKIVSDNIPVSNVKVELLLNNEVIDLKTTPRNGKASFTLDLNNVYKIRVSKKGYIPEFLEVSTNMPKSFGELKQAYSVDVEISLIDLIEEVDVSVFENPVAKYKFDESKNEFNEDINYKNTIQNDINKVVEKVEAIQNELYGTDFDKIREEVKDGDISGAITAYRESKEAESEAGIKEKEEQDVDEETGEVSIEKMKESLKKLEAKGNKVEISDMLQNIANVYYENENYKNSIEYFEKSLEIEKESGNEDAIAEIKNDIAIVYYDSGKYTKAIEHLEESYQIKKNTDNKEGMASTLKDIATIYENTYQFDHAVDYYKKSLDVSEELGDKTGSADLLNNIGDVYFEQNNYDSTIEYYEKSMEVDEELDNEIQVSNALNNLGVVYYKRNDYDKAIENYENAIKIKEKNNDKAGIATVLNNIGNVNYDWEKYQKALEYYQNSLTIKREIDYKQGIAISLYNIANAYQKLNKVNEAIDNYSASIKVADEIQDNELKAKNYRALYKTYLNNNECDKAIEYNELYASVNVSLYADDGREVISEVQMKYDKDLKIAKLKMELRKQKLLAQFQAMRTERELKIKDLEIQKKEEINKKQRIIIFSAIAGIVFIIVFLFLIYRGYVQKKKANALLVLKNKKIEEQKKNITDSIQYASKIQKALLPPEQFIDELISDYFVLFKPRDIVSGDFYWIGRQKNKIIIVAADSTGHGVPGAFMSMLGIAFLNEVVNKIRDLNAGKILDELRKLVIKSLRQTKEVAEGSKDGMDLALCIIDFDNFELEFAGAFNPLYLIRNNELNEIKGDKMPIAIHRFVDRPFSNHKIKIEKNDSIYMFSDGYIDQFGGPEDRKFMTKQFKELLLANHTLPMSKQKNILEMTIEKWMGDNHQIDDMLVFGIKIT